MHYNKKLLKEFYEENKEDKAPERTCCCTRGKPCPLQGKCLTQDIIYRAKISATDTEDKFYIGLTAPPFKKRFSNHKSSFKNLDYSQSTTLSSYVWQLKNEGKNPSVSFSILQKSKSFTPEILKCYLCTAEKMRILFADPSKTINKRSEIMSTCRHKRKFLLSQIPST